MIFMNLNVLVATQPVESFDAFEDLCDPPGLAEAWAPGISKGLGQSRKFAFC